MASGTFTTTNKERPGMYSNFQSGKMPVGINASGVIAMTIPLNWGIPNTFERLTSQSNFFNILGQEIGEKDLLLVQEALKSAQTILLFNVAGESSTKATGVLATDVVVEATKFGRLGNDITVIVEENLDSDFEISTYFKSTLVDKQIIVEAEDFVENDYVRISGTGTLTDVNVALTGGITDPSTADNYLEFFKGLELRDFYAFCLDTNDDNIKRTAANYCKKWRDQEGKKVVLVTELSANYEGVVNVANGVVLDNGTALTALQCTPYIAGLMASAGIDRSLTYTHYDGAVDANPRMLHVDVEDALKAGKLVFTNNQNAVMIEQDINSLTTFTDSKNKEFRKNKIIRIVDTLHNELLNMYSNSFIGIISNDEDGRELLKKDILALLEQFRQHNAVNEFTSEDIAVMPGTDKDSVVVNMAISVADAMEKMYVTVTLN
jgi:Phage tail sheath protein.